MHNFTSLVLTSANLPDSVTASPAAARRLDGNTCYWCTRCGADSSPNPWSAPTCAHTIAICVCVLRVDAALAISWAHASDDDDNRWARNVAGQTYRNRRRNRLLLLLSARSFFFGCCFVFFAFAVCLCFNCV